MGHRNIHANGSTIIDILESTSQSLPKNFQIHFPRDVRAFFKIVNKKIVDYTDKNHVMKKDVMHLLLFARKK
jgi:hypothetical protein